MRSNSLALFVICVIPVVAVAQTDAAPATTPPTAADTPVTGTDDQKLICVVQDPDTASRLRPKRVCHTRQEWTKLGGVPK
jgi:hypothetical protein